MLKLERLLGFVVCAFAVALSLRITITWGVLIAGLVIWLVWKLVRLRSGASKRLLELGPLSIPLLAYAAAVTISGSGRAAPELGSVNAKELLANFGTLRSLVVYFWAFDVFSTCPKFRLPAVLCMLLASGLGGTVAAVQQLTRWDPWGGRFLQGTGFLSEPMAFSGVMQVFSLVAIGMLIAGGFRRFRRPFNHLAIFSIIAIANVAGLIFASERSAWLGFVVALLAAVGLVSWRLILATTGGLGLAIAAAWFVVPVVKIRVQPMLTGQSDPGIASRLQVWHRAYAEFLKSPVTGIGTTKFPHMEMKDATVLGKSYLAHAHSNVLQILSTAGILGLCSYIFIVFGALYTAVKHLIRNTPTARRWRDSKQQGERGIAIGVFAALVSLTISGLAEYNFGTGQVRFALWFVLALLSTDA